MAVCGAVITGSRMVKPVAGPSGCQPAVGVADDVSWERQRPRPSGPDGAAPLPRRKRGRSRTRYRCPGRSCRSPRRHPPAATARPRAIDRARHAPYVLQDAPIYRRAAARLQLLAAAARAFFGGGGDEELAVGVGAARRCRCRGRRARRRRRPAPKRALEGEQRRAHRRDRRDHRRRPGSPPRSRRPGDGEIGRRRAPRPPPPPAAASSSVSTRLEQAARDRAVEQAGVEDRRDRTAAASRRASVPLPEAAGPSMAMMRGRLPAHGSSVSISAPSRFSNAAKPGKLVSIGSASSTVTGSRARASRARGSSSRCGGRGRRRSPPPPGGAPAAAVDRPGRRAPTSTATPQAARPSAIAAEPVALLDPQLGEARA